jgi:hypothetical protein
MKITKTAKRLNMKIGAMKMQIQTNTTRFADANKDINIRRPVYSTEEDSRRERNKSELRK